MNADELKNNPSILEKTKNNCTVPKTETLSFSDTATQRTLEDMDKSVENYKCGKVSDIVNLSDFDEI